MRSFCSRLVANACVHLGQQVGESLPKNRDAAISSSIARRVRFFPTSSSFPAATSASTTVVAALRRETSNESPRESNCDIESSICSQAPNRNRTICMRRMSGSSPCMTLNASSK